MLTLFALILCLLMLAVFVELALGFHKVKSLKTTRSWIDGKAPVVSVIVPACNEEASIEAALRSLCRQEYAHLEIIVVNDRSTDRTAEIIESVRQDYPQVKTIHIENLPAGWLGKPHALHIGAGIAKGDFLLFTDADVSLEQTTISRAVRVMFEKRLDHLALIFENNSGGRLLNTLITDAGAGLLLLFKPWKAGDPGSRFFIGVGAFNMVRSSAYSSIEGHERIRMQAIDDIFLGKIIKYQGFKQECMLGYDFVMVPWYHTVSEMVLGLMKNVYALFNYRFLYAFAALTAITLAVIVPFAGAMFASGPAQILFLCAVLIRIAGVGFAMIAAGHPPGSVLYLFITPFISIYIISKAVWTVQREGGITWRGTFYPLKELKKADWLLSKRPDNWYQNQADNKK